MGTVIGKAFPLVVIAVLLGAFLGLDARAFEVPPVVPAAQYGNVLINRLSDKHGQPWVTFSHWRHRLQYTCRVCHLELNFEMKTNATEITEAANRRGEYCGTCHDGETAFGHTEENCVRCHNGNISNGEEKFSNLAFLPMSRYGNQIDWTAAVRRGLISPKQSLFDDNYAGIGFRDTLSLEPAEWANISPALFSHEIHNQWLDCANCHPYIFNIKKKTTEHFEMKYIVEGKFCGACHLNVAFPINDCNRCHCDR